MGAVRYVDLRAGDVRCSGPLKCCLNTTAAYTAAVAPGADRKGSKHKAMCCSMLKPSLVRSQAGRQAGG